MLHQTATPTSSRRRRKFHWIIHKLLTHRSQLLLNVAVNIITAYRARILKFSRPLISTFSYLSHSPKIKCAHFFKLIVPSAPKLSTPGVATITFGVRFNSSRCLYVHSIVNHRAFTLSMCTKPRHFVRYLIREFSRGHKMTAPTSFGVGSTVVTP